MGQLLSTYVFCFNTMLCCCLPLTKLWSEEMSSFLSQKNNISSNPCLLNRCNVNVLMVVLPRSSLESAYLL
uniref:Putative secreted protein n=1 Tax=Anopheles darlingi TaxID=43151 RepID=A0A2M4D4H1_ANODA